MNCEEEALEEATVAKWVEGLMVGGSKFCSITLRHPQTRHAHSAMPKMGCASIVRVANAWRRRSISE